MLAPQASTRIALNNILFATDFSKVSNAALPFVLALAEQYSAKIFVVNAVGPEPYLSMPLEPIPMGADLFWNDAQRRLTDFVAATAFDGIAHQEVLRRGGLWEVVSRIMHEERIDLIVMGTHGRHGLTKLVLGSEAEKVYRQAICPVLTVGPEVPAPAGTDWKLKRILFPTDLSTTSENALHYAVSLAQDNEATLTLFHTIPMVPWQQKESVERSTREQMKAMLPREAHCRVEFRVGFEFLADGILRFTEEQRADLIVMGVAKPAAAAWTAHMGSAASEVISEAPCPVLTVRG